MNSNKCLESGGILTFILWYETFFFFFYLLELSDAGVAAESLLLPVHQQEVVGRRSARQVIAALLAAVHDQAVGPAVHVKARVTADLVGHSLKADLMPDLSTEQEKKN